MKIAVISCSVRAGRKSHRVALYLERFIREGNYCEVELVDLKELAIPLMEERLNNLRENAPASAIAFGKSVSQADAVILVTPEYNSGLPASTKNAIDLLNEEWVRKPVGLATVSAGPFAGANVSAHLQNVLLRLRAVPIGDAFPTPTIDSSYDEAGNPTDKARTDKRAIGFITSLLWFAEAFRRMKP